MNISAYWGPYQKWKLRLVWIQHLNKTCFMTWDLWIENTRHSAELHLTSIFRFQLSDDLCDLYCWPAVSPWRSPDPPIKRHMFIIKSVGVEEVNYYVCSWNPLWLLHKIFYPCVIEILCTDWLLSPNVCRMFQLGPKSCFGHNPGSVWESIWPRWILPVSHQVLHVWTTHPLSHPWL